jgi:hypothetical protein
VQAVQATSFGGPSVLQVVNLPDPAPGPGRISIDVTHSAVGLIDRFFRQGICKDVPGMPQPPFIPGLEAAGAIRQLGEGVTGFTVGEKVVSMSAGGSTGGYAPVFVTRPASVVSTEGYGIDPALAVAVLPNAVTAHIALSHIAYLAEGESVLVRGALDGFPAAFPGGCAGIRRGRRSAPPGGRWHDLATQTRRRHGAHRNGDGTRREPPGVPVTWSPGRKPTCCIHWPRKRANPSSSRESSSPRSFCWLGVPL